MSGCVGISSTRFPVCIIYDGNSVFQCPLFDAAILSYVRLIHGYKSNFNPRFGTNRLLYIRYDESVTPKRGYTPLPPYFVRGEGGMFAPQNFLHSKKFLHWLFRVVLYNATTKSLRPNGLRSHDGRSCNGVATCAQDEATQLPNKVSDLSRPCPCRGGNSTSYFLFGSRSETK